MKRIILGIAVLAVIAVAAINVNLSATQKSDMSLLALANVEALANFEFPDAPYCDTYHISGKASRCWILWYSVYSPLPKCKKTGNPDDYCYSL